MEITDKTASSVRETRYLGAENCARYRPILRLFYLEYQKLTYWLSRQDVFDQLSLHDPFEGYTPEQLQHDLDALVEWGNLEPVQDTSRAATVEAFINRQFRYRLTEYAVEIERMVIRFENLSAEGASLQPSLLERMLAAISLLPAVLDEPPDQVDAWWRDLESDFRRLNSDYQDYLRTFISPEGRGHAPFTGFSHTKGQARWATCDTSSKACSAAAKPWSSACKQCRTMIGERLVAIVAAWEAGIPRLDGEVSEVEIAQSLRDRWNSLRAWFAGSQTAMRVRCCASCSSPMTSSAASHAMRRACPKPMAPARTGARNTAIWRSCSSPAGTTDAHRLSSLVFGLFGTRHVRGVPERTTESTSASVYDEPPFELVLKPRVRQYRERMGRTVLRNRMDEREAVRQDWLDRIVREQTAMDAWMQDDRLDTGLLPVIGATARATLLKWIGDALAVPDHAANTEDGRIVHVALPAEEERCTLHCEDGDFDMPRFLLTFTRRRTGGGR
jgi:hypothetical protein